MVRYPGMVLARMSRQEIKLKRRVRELEAALQPFAAVPVSTFYPDQSVWIYSGDKVHLIEAPLNTEHFEIARRVLMSH